MISKTKMLELSLDAIRKEQEAALKLYDALCFEHRAHFNYLKDLEEVK